VQIAVVSSK